uniref:Uncharacterized protein n=1 Tax=Alexandrium catenella TaxID=2925 RepID=A0A7S1WF07_ALECA|mmetsp:Transcript_55964/g.149790  ORF Transcript_55964/g.149790 Transcript_55964/m.149790 type:complete len:173 (+) Transcript_55964:99-617(+)|eukprot:CAMPEP_0171291170 /NCGR_PEP_ID=MMETSP0790-20130122/71517_1 /TAXON_ID=2925 /ORGANISM="Alexandrium catenella, Strain OF101" /LENGTH=172 /DNA_ID=CAMNT_0011760891 /DNA_START=46 /DNA_END=564 /DNA_ORIENTATION=+
MPGRAAPAAPAPKAAQKAGPAAESGAAAADAEGARPALDTQAIHETAARTVLGAQKLFGNLTGFIREAQSAVADTWSGLQGGEEGGGGPLGGPLNVRRRAAEALQSKGTAATSGAGAAASAQAASRREIAKSDAAQYFVEYKGLDLSLLNQDMLEPRHAERERRKGGDHVFT